MLHKCANPPCTNLFRKMSEGRLFQFSRPAVQVASRKQSSGRMLEYFWLCDRCLSTMTIVFDPVSGVHAVSPAAHAAKSFPPIPPDPRHTRMPLGDQP